MDRRIDGWRTLAIASFVVTYLLIVLGGVVRITGSGMGCGDDWPMCNGRWFPPMDLPTFIEWSHRLVAAVVSLLVVSLAVWGVLRRAGRGWARRARYGLIAAALLVVQVLLGAITVWLELPPWSVILHLGTAMLLLCTLLLAAQGAADGPPSWRAGDGATRMAVALAALTGIVVLLGALVANLGAAAACQGFPLCNGSLVPGGHWRIHLHWTHRLAAYLAVAGIVALPWVGARARGSAWLAAGLAVLQVAVAADMVLRLLPDSMQAAHLAIGTALFASVVSHAHRRGRTD